MIDPLDIRIMEELEADARQTYKDIAAKVGLSRPTVINRVQQLQERGVIKTICWVNPSTFGFKFVIPFFIFVEGGQIGAVAERLASCSQIMAIDLCTGSYDVVSWGVFRNREELASFFLNELSSVPGIGYVEKLVLLKEVKGVSKFLKEGEPTVLPNKLNIEPSSLDDRDIELIKELQINAGQKIGALAQKLGASKPTISRRIRILANADIIRIITMVDPFTLGYDGVVITGLKCETDKTEKVATKVASYRQVQHVSICAGKYDVLAWMVFPTLSDLRRFITNELGSIHGLKDVETMLRYKLVKITPRFPT